MATKELWVHFRFLFVLPEVLLRGVDSEKKGGGQFLKKVNEIFQKVGEIFQKVNEIFQKVADFFQ